MVLAISGEGPENVVDGAVGGVEATGEGWLLKSHDFIREMQKASV